MQGEHTRSVMGRAVNVELGLGSKVRVPRMPLNIKPRVSRHPGARVAPGAAVQACKWWGLAVCAAAQMVGEWRGVRAIWHTA